MQFHALDLQPLSFNEHMTLPKQTKQDTTHPGPGKATSPTISVVLDIIGKEIMF